VKAMEPEDVGELIGMGARMHMASRYRRKNYSPEKLVRMGAKWLATPATCFCAVAWRGDVRVGFFVGLITEFFFGHDRAAYDVLLYVEKSARGGVAAWMLVDAYRKWARSQSIPDDAIYAGVSAPDVGPERSRTYRFYEKLGFSEIGRTFCMRDSHV